MSKLIIITFCFCLSIGYYSFFKPINKQEINLTMVLLDTIKSNNLSKQEVNELLETTGVPRTVKFSVKENLFLTSYYSNREENTNFSY